MPDEHLAWNRANGDVAVPEQGRKVKGGLGSLLLSKERQCQLHLFRRALAVIVGGGTEALMVIRITASDGMPPLCRAGDDGTDVTAELMLVPRPSGSGTIAAVAAPFRLCSNFGREEQEHREDWNETEAEHGNLALDLEAGFTGSREKLRAGSR